MPFQSHAPALRVSVFAEGRINYRSEIDGLRTIAVVPVILFHAGFEMFRGGFVGVDIFFVISGYLITRIILDDLESGSFSVVKFYERRARRILPALFAVMLACIPFAWAWMLPGQFRDFAQSLVAVSLFASNFLFWRESGYFATAAEQKPLLHTWSLAVEEQYYILFPLLLLILWRFGRNPVFWSLVALASLSLALAEIGWRTDPTANFYLAPSRAWELLAGSICALIHHRSAPRAGNLQSAIGLVLILAGLLLFSENTPTPSLWTTVPVLGTALILLYGQCGTLVARLLSWRPMVLIGLISYSAYLWHQPLFAFARVGRLDSPGPGLMMTLAIATFAIAWVSWRFIERPFRTGPRPLLRRQRQVFLASGTAAACFIGFGVAGFAGNGLPGRFDPAILALAAAGADRNDRVGDCLPDASGFSVATALDRCSAGPREGFRVLLLGDSHADHLAQALREAADNHGFRFTQFTVNSCPPFADLVTASYDCRRFHRDVSEYLDSAAVDAIVLSIRWTSNAEFSRFDNGEGGVETGVIHPFQIGSAHPGSPGYRDALLTRFTDGVRGWLDRDIPVVLVYPSPEAGWNVPERAVKLAPHVRRISDLSISTAFSAYQTRNLAVISALDALEAPGLHRVRPADILCNSFLADRCVNVIHGQVFYVDDDHLSNAGARLIVPSIVDRLQVIVGHRSAVTN